MCLDPVAPSRMTANPQATSIIPKPLKKISELRRGCARL